MNTPSRLHYFFDQHIGVGLRWRSVFYQFELSLSLPLVTIVLGFGRPLVGTEAVE